MSHEHHEHHGEEPDSVKSPYWTTLDQYHETPEYLARRGEEFYPEAKPEKYFDAVESGALNPELERRSFLKLSGFAAVLAAAAGCERPVQKILPYVNKPEEVTYGVPNHYASTCMECPAACGTLVTSREGRPTKVEGNPDHPMNRGKLCATGQASVLNLYDPDRARTPLRKVARGGEAKSVTMQEAWEYLGGALRGTTGEVVILARPTSSPTTKRLYGQLGEALGKPVRVVEYDPLGPADTADAYEALYAKRLHPRFRFDRVKTLVLLGGDPIAQGVSRVEYQAGIAARRKPGSAMSRIYSFEPAPTITGVHADYHYPVKPASLLPIALAIGAELLAKGVLTGGAALRELFEGIDTARVESDAGLKAGTIARVAASLEKSKAESLLYAEGAGAYTANGRDLAMVVALINRALGAESETIDLAGSPSHQSANNGHAAVLGLIEQMAAGQVGALILNGVNPAFNLPKSAGFVAASSRVPLVAAFGLKYDETARLADVFIPTLHWLESWGDAEPQKGLFSTAQPLVAPLFNGRSFEESMIAVASAAGSEMFLREAPAPIGATTETLAMARPKLPMTHYEYLRETWRAVHEAEGYAADFEDFWISLIRGGVLDRAEEAREAPAGLAREPRLPDLAAIRRAAFVPASKGVALVVQPSIVHGDGSSMSNPFLMELPDPISRVAWDNYLAVSPRMAKDRGWEQGIWVEVAAGEDKVELPVFILPGLEPSTVEVCPGWGRTAVGEVGNGIGVDVFPLLTVASGRLVLSGREVTVTKLEGDMSSRNRNRVSALASDPINAADWAKPSRYPFANVQGHNYLEGRPIFFETTLKEWEEDPAHGQYNHHPRDEFKSIWGKEHKYTGHHWGMVIDYNACTGCGACVVACQVENNIPAVGKADMVRGREMHWIRIDRYYRGDPENPDHAYQVMLCQHCATAPCETVCPVIATLHNDEGLNTMIYNRCVGTRYCSNNCPYKVRRFNWFAYSEFRSGYHEAHRRVSPLELVLNPDVTVRSRGVMEKCTFCVHRIKRSKEKARELGRPLQDGEMLTACQQTCPAKAIVFGDRNDPQSELMKLWGDDRAYGVLSDLNTQPGVRYLTLVRNRDEKTPKEYLGKHGKKHGKGHGGKDDHHDEKKSDHSEATSHSRKEG